MPQTPKPLDPSRSARHRFGAELRAARVNWGLSQARLAKLIHVHPDLIAKVEKAVRWPTEALARSCDSALGTDGTLTAMWADVARERQHDLQSGRFSLALPPDDSPRRRTDEVSPPGAINDLAALRSFRAADRQLGGGHIYATVANYLHHNVAPRMFGSTATAPENDVLAVAATLTEMAGWMAHDLGNHSRSRRHFERALDLARHHDQLCAHILGSLGHLAQHTWQPETALAYAERGQQRLAAGGPPHPRIDARLLAVKARAHAAMAAPDECVAALQRAEQLLAMPADRASAWISQFDEASLAMDAARCFQQLGQFSTAKQYAERILALRPLDRTRSRALAQLITTSIAVAEGQLEEACAVGNDVLAATRTLGSYLVVEQLEQLAKLLTPYRQSRDVADFLDVLRGELNDRRWWAHTSSPPELESQGASLP